MIFKKPKFWDLKKPNILAYLLFPLTVVIYINNILLNFSKKKKYEKIKSICVGNIYLGGTGKTPLTVELYKLTKNIGYSVSVGKKYYKSQMDEQEILKQNTNLNVDFSRKRLIENAIKNQTKLIIFDDGLQDRLIEYDMKFVCFDADQWIGNSFLLPSGPLREKITSLKKYDAVFLKKNHKNDGTQKIENIIKNINSKIKIFYTYYKPTNLENFESSKKYIIFSGIGNPRNFRKLIEQSKINIVDEIIFPDHYNYTQKDIENLEKKARSLNSEVITTEKDFTKISKFTSNNIKCLKVELVIENKENLKSFLIKKLHG